MKRRTYLIDTLLHVNCSKELHSTENSQGIIEDSTFRTGSIIRDLFTQYFCTSGAIQQQWAKAYTNDY